MKVVMFLSKRINVTSPLRTILSWEKWISLNEFVRKGIKAIKTQLLILTLTMFKLKKIFAPKLLVSLSLWILSVSLPKSKMPRHKFYKSLPVALNYSVKNDYVIVRMQGQPADWDWSRTGQERCLLLNYAPPGVSGKAYCLCNLNAFFSTHSFCWSNTLLCTTAQTFLLTARNLEGILFISAGVRFHSEGRQNKYKIFFFSSWETLDRDFRTTVLSVSEAHKLSVSLHVTFSWKTLSSFTFKQRNYSQMATKWEVS